MHNEPQSEEDILFNIYYEAFIGFSSKLHKKTYTNDIQKQRLIESYNYVAKKIKYPEYDPNIFES